MTGRMKHSECTLCSCLSGMFVSCTFVSCCTDKQQEIDMPVLKVDDVDAPAAPEAPEAPIKVKEKDGKKALMSQISGVRKLKHTNSFTGVVPKWGVEAKNEEELGNVSKITELCVLPIAYMTVQSQIEM